MNSTLSWIIIATGFVMTVLAQLGGYIQKQIMDGEDKSTNLVKLLYRIKDVVSLLAVFVAHNVRISLGSVVIIGAWTWAAAYFHEYNDFSTMVGYKWSLINGLTLGLLLPSFMKGIRSIVM